MPGGPHINQGGGRVESQPFLKPDSGSRESSLSASRPIESLAERRKVTEILDMGGGGGKREHKTR